jgi:membrane-associated phospholipid phosphatase
MRLALALLLFSSVSWAGEPEPLVALPPPKRVDVPYQLRLDLDLGLLLGGVVLWGGTSFVGAGSAPPSWCGTASTPPCDASGINALDRPAIGLYNAEAKRTADALAGAVPGALTIMDVVDAGIKNWRGWLSDAVVITEAVVWDGAVQDIVRRAVRRPRPYMYTPGLNPGAREGPEANFSFFSGHTSGTFAMATATAFTYSLRHPGSKWQYLVWTLALAGATSEPILRVIAGDHFPVDCIVGALVGTASGILFPALHRKRLPIRLISSVTQDQATVGVAGRF